jgi:hypothetical protein
MPVPSASRARALVPWKSKSDESKNHQLGDSADFTL